MNRKKKATSLVTDALLASRYGELLKALRVRRGISAEKLAKELGYQRPSQVFAREKGDLSIPLSEIKTTAGHLRIDPKLLMFASVIAFHTPIFAEFRAGLAAELGFLPNLDAGVFLDCLIADIESDGLLENWAVTRGNLRSLSRLSLYSLIDTPIALHPVRNGTASQIFQSPTDMSKAIDTVSPHPPPSMH